MTTMCFRSTRRCSKVLLSGEKHPASNAGAFENVTTNGQQWRLRTSCEPAVATSVNQVGRELKFLLPPDDHPCIRRGTLKFGSGAYLDGLRIPTFWNRDTGVCRSRHKADKAESSDCKCSSTACAFALCCEVRVWKGPRSGAMSTGHEPCSQGMAQHTSS
ncbi:Acriflavine sensitivity control protein acr-2 [Fusarium oxysporum f. sp. albedinis]|nr:Acriflavine sensitivity control protein acr-2 [Fusarium oxysporum f. sp. albedinis]